MKAINDYWTSKLNPKSRRYREWHDILGSDEVPLKDPMSKRVLLDEKLTSVYGLDLAELSPEQRQRLVEFAVKKLSIPADQVEQQLNSVGFPIREDDAIVTLNRDRFGAFL